MKTQEVIYSLHYLSIYFQLGLNALAMISLKKSRRYSTRNATMLTLFYKSKTNVADVIYESIHTKGKEKEKTNEKGLGEILQRLRRDSEAVLFFYLTMKSIATDTLNNEEGKGKGP